jgi:hypothetical protein
MKKIPRRIYFHETKGLGKLLPNVKAVSACPKAEAISLSLC